MSRLAGVSINTVSKLLVDAGQICAAFHDEMVRNVEAKRVQADEMWSFVGAKKKSIQKDPSILERNGDAGDVWTWTAIDADTKRCISYLVGARDSHSAYALLSDINRVNPLNQTARHGVPAVVRAEGGRHFSAAGGARLTSRA